MTALALACAAGPSVAAPADSLRARPAIAPDSPASHASAADTSHATAADSSAGVRVVPRSAEPDTAAAPQRWTSQPRVVMLRSLLVPGWGQLHNHAYVKAVAVAGVEGWLIASAISDQRSLQGLRDAANAAAASGQAETYGLAAKAYNARLDRLVGRQWLLGGVLAYALVDAYVDAHFRNFDLEFRNDPALTPASPAEGPGAAAAGPVSRLALRWTF